MSVAERLRRDPGLVFVIAALVAAVAAYAPTLGYGLVNYDDPWLVRDNWIVQDASWSSLHAIFFDLDSPKRFVLTPEYLPIRDVSVMLDFAIWGDRFAGFHLTNLLLYAGSIVVWFAALAAFGIDRKLAGIAMLLWALHPSHAESVAWISERKGLLAMLFAGGGALAYARYRAGRAWGYLALAALAAVLAVWSKATGAFAVLALVALEVVLPGRASWRRSIAGLAAIGVVAAAAFVPVLALASDAAVIGDAAHPPAGRVAMVLGVHGFYLRASALGVANAVSYPLATDGPTAADIALGTLGLGLVIAVLARRRAPAELRAGAAIWLVGWLPASHLLVPLKMIVVADRYLLFPTLGFALMLGAGIARIPRPVIRHALLAAIVLLSIVRTLSAAANWRDPETLWASAVASNPADGNAWSYYIEAHVAVHGGDGAALVDEALRHAKSPQLLHRQALLVLPTDRARGRALMQQAAEGGDAIACSNLALLLLEDRALPDALAWARAGVAARPNAHAYRTLGKVALGAGQAGEALAAFERALVLEPSCTNHYNVALALVTLKQPGARVHLDRCADDPRVGPHARALRDRL